MGDCRAERARIDKIQTDKTVGEVNMPDATPDFDAIVIGAGFSGMHMLKSLRDSLG